jgi:hypothetical protein
VYKEQNLPAWFCAVVCVLPSAASWINEGFHEPQGVDAAVMERGPDKVGGATGAAGFDRLALQQRKRQVLLG